MASLVSQQQNLADGLGSREGKQHKQGWELGGNPTGSNHSDPPRKLCVVS
jgi:hypothetical protein